jgi:hypothetical protein
VHEGLPLSDSIDKHADEEISFAKEKKEDNKEEDNKEEDNKEEDNKEEDNVE